MNLKYKSRKDKQPLSFHIQSVSECVREELRYKMWYLVKNIVEDYVQSPTADIMTQIVEDIQHNIWIMTSVSETYIDPETFS